MWSNKVISDTIWFVGLGTLKTKSGGVRDVLGGDFVFMV